MYLNKQNYGFDRYCLDKSERTVGGWKLMICDQDVNYHIIFNIVGMLKIIEFREIKDRLQIASYLRHVTRHRLVEKVCFA